METTYYTLTAREILMEGAAVQRASGDSARQFVCVRKAAQKTSVDGGKVIDLAAWKADREEEARLEEAWYGDVAEEAFAPDYEEDIAEQREYVRRARRNHKRMMNFELASCVAVVAVMAVLVIRILGVF